MDLEPHNLTEMLRQKPLPEPVLGLTNFWSVRVDKPERKKCQGGPVLGGRRASLGVF